MDTENHELLIKVLTDLETLPLSVGNHKILDKAFVIQLHLLVIRETLLLL